MCMMSDGQMSTQCPHPSHLVMYTNVGMSRLLFLVVVGRFALDAESHVHRSVPQQFHGVPLLLFGIVTGLRWQIFGRAVGPGYPFLEGCRRLEEHVGELRPRHPAEEHDAREAVEPDEQAYAAAHGGPGDPERHAPE